MNTLIEKLKKLPPWGWAVIVAAPLLLIVHFRKSSTTSTGTATTAQPYASPNTPASGVSAQDVASAINSFKDQVATQFDQQQTQFKSMLQDVTTGLLNQNQVLQQHVDQQQQDFGNTVGVLTSHLNQVTTTTQNQLADLSSKLAEKSTPSVSDVAAQLKANAAAWSSASPAERQKLHDKNIELGTSIGATYNSQTGEWTKGGKVLNT